MTSFYTNSPSKHPHRNSKKNLSSLYMGYYYVVDWVAFEVINIRPYVYSQPHVDLSLHAILHYLQIQTPSNLKLLSQACRMEDVWAFCVNSTTNLSIKGSQNYLYPQQTSLNLCPMLEGRIHIIYHPLFPHHFHVFWESVLINYGRGWTYHLS